MKVLFINNDGGGFAGSLVITEGTTVEQLFAAQVPQGHPESYLIRVDRQPAAADQVLQAGQRVSFTPLRIEGA